MDGLNISAVRRQLKYMLSYEYKNKEAVFVCMAENDQDALDQLKSYLIDCYALEATHEDDTKNI